MTQQELELHQTLIRNGKHLLATARTMLDAWEAYVRSQMPPPEVIENPDPVKHFAELHRRR